MAKAALLVVGCALAQATACAPRAPLAQTAPAEPAALTFSPGSTDPARKAKLLAIAPQLDQHLLAKMNETGATGVAAGIVLDGELVYARGFGVLDVVTRAPVDQDSVFRIASMTKNITAAAVLKLRDEGKVVLDAPASSYVAELANVRGPTRDAPAMTVRQLLTMSSGLPYDDSWGVVTFGLDDEAFAAFLRGGMTLATVPGERYLYSNLGYALLGKVVERASHRRYRDYVTEKLLRPLGMSSTVWEATAVPRSRLAVGYSRKGTELTVEPRPPDGVFAAGGGLYTSLRDYARYVAFQLAAYPARDDAEAGPLRRSTVREMHQGQRWGRWRGDAVPIVARGADGALSLSAASYGFGWLNNTTCIAEGIVQHGGAEPGYWSTVHLLPEYGAGIFVFSTTGATGWRSFEGTVALLREAGVLSERLRPPAPALIQAREDIARLLEQWQPALVARAFDEPSLRYSWMANFRADFEKLKGRHGRCRPDGEPVALTRTHGTLRLACERGALEFTAYLTPSVPPRIQQLDWREEFAPDERAGALVKRIIALIGNWDEQAAAQLFAPQFERDAARRKLARLASIDERCELERALSSDGRGGSTFRLACGRAPVDLWFKIDEGSGLVTDFNASRAVVPFEPCRD